MPNLEDLDSGYGHAGDEIDGYTQHVGVGHVYHDPAYELSFIGSQFS